MASAVSFVNLMFFVAASYFKFFFGRGSGLSSAVREVAEDSGFGRWDRKFLQDLKDGDFVYLALDRQHPDFF